MLCIPKKDAEKLKIAVRNGDFTISKLYNMTTEERRTIFESYTSAPMAQFINARFEKAMVSKQKDALKKWVEQTFPPKKQEIRDRAIERIEDMKELLNPAEGEEFLKDLVMTKLGASVSEEEAKVIVEKTEKIRSLAPAVKEDGTIENVTETGLPTKEYLQAYNDMEQYLKSVNPTNNLRIMTSLFGRAAMLFRPSSIILNIQGNTLNGLLTYLEKKIGYVSTEGVFKGDNTDLAKEFVKENFSNYLSTGFDFTRMNQMSEGHKILNEDIIHAEGGGFIKKFLGRPAEKFLKLSQGLPDVFFASSQFADTANTYSTAIANREGLTGDARKTRAREIMTDAFRMEPFTEEGQEVRDAAQADAMRATYTDSTIAAKVSLQIRKIFNDLVPNLRLGDLNIPFAKTPANIVGQGIEMAGGGLIEAAYQMYEFKKSYQELGIGSPEGKVRMRKAIRAISKFGLGMLVAQLVASLVDPDDFIGAYPVNEAERKLLESRNATENSIKIGNKWISLQYFGPFAPVIAGVMYAKKDKTGGFDNVLQYFTGIGKGLATLPGIKQLRDAINYILDDSNNERKGKTTKELSVEVMNGLIDFTRARLIPGIISDIAKMTDSFERKTDAQSAITRAQSNIPGLRQGLPVKKTIFGDRIKTEAALSILIFGSKVKTATDNRITQELVKLYEKDQLPALNNPENSASFKKFKTQVSKPVFESTVQKSKTRFKKELSSLMNSSQYRRENSAGKKELIDNLKNSIRKEELENAGYRKK